MFHCSMQFILKMTLKLSYDIVLLVKIVAPGGRGKEISPPAVILFVQVKGKNRNTSSQAMGADGFLSLPALTSVV